MDVAGKFDYRILKGTGLAPSDFELLNGMCSRETAIQLGYHPDDNVQLHKMERHDDKIFPIDQRE